MTVGIIGKKLGMTQIFTEDGKSEAITAIEAGPCTVVQIKTPEKDGYAAVKLGYGEIEKRTRKGQAKGKKIVPRYLREFRPDPNVKAEVGQKIDVSLFKAGDLVDITGISRGKGFAGGVRRYHFRGGPKTHGQSDRWRAPGSVGSNTNPGRTFKGQRMAGHMGNKRVTISNLKVIQADTARNLLIVKGAVPGATNGLLLIKKSRKVKK